MRNAIGKRVIEARQLRGKTQVATAEMLGLARQTYLDIETGKTRVKADTLLEISKQFNVSISWLYGVNEKDKQSEKLYRLEQLVTSMNHVIKT